MVTIVIIYEKLCTIWHHRHHKNCCLNMATLHHATLPRTMIYIWYRWLARPVYSSPTQQALLQANTVFVTVFAIISRYMFFASRWRRKGRTRKLGQRKARLISLVRRWMLQALLHDHPCHHLPSLHLSLAFPSLHLSLAFLHMSLLQEAALLHYWEIMN